MTLEQDMQKLSLTKEDIKKLEKFSEIYPRGYGGMVQLQYLIVRSLMLIANDVAAIREAIEKNTMTSKV